MCLVTLSSSVVLLLLWQACCIERREIGPINLTYLNMILKSSKGRHWCAILSRITKACRDWLSRTPVERNIACMTVVQLFRCLNEGNIDILRGTSNSEVVLLSN